MLRLACALFLLLITPEFAFSAQEFKDVPSGHWAADSVKALADAGIVRGYPDGSFKGDQPVTRYELAVALDGMIKFIQASFQPIKADSRRQEKNWADESLTNLKAGGFLPPDSPILKQPDKPVTADELAQALASVSARLIELRVPEGDQREEPAQ